MRNDFKNGSVITGMGSILYGDHKVEVKDNYTSVQGSIISPNTVVLDQDGELAKRGVMQGIIYCGAGDKATIKHTIIHGSVVAWEYGGEEIHCCYTLWDASYLPTTCPPGFTVTGGGNTVQIVDGSWRVVR